MKTAHIIAIITLALLIAACSKTTIDGEATQGSQIGNTITLVADDDGQYSPAVMKLKLGDTVRIEGDPATLVGGMDTVIVDGYNVQKKIAPDDNVLEFKADRKGEFLVHCANGMGNGKLIVE